MTTQYTRKSNFFLSIIKGLLIYLDKTRGFFFGIFDQSETTLIPSPLAEAGGFKILFFQNFGLTIMDILRIPF